MYGPRGAPVGPVEGPDDVGDAKVAGDDDEGGKDEHEKGVGVVEDGDGHGVFGQRGTNRPAAVVVVKV